jgi:hypothetical protein
MIAWMRWLFPGEQELRAVEVDRDNRRASALWWMRLLAVAWIRSGCAGGSALGLEHRVERYHGWVTELAALLVPQALAHFASVAALPRLSA